MTKSKTYKTKGAAAIVTVAVLALIALFGMVACSNAAQPDAGTGGSAALPEAPFVEGGASLILSPDKLDITVKVTTSDGTSVTVEGCTETELQSGTQTVLHAQGTTVKLIGRIFLLYCRNNRLTALDVQGLTSLESLACGENQLTALNVQSLTALKDLGCNSNQLTALNVQGLTALQTLYCGDNQLTSLNVQGLTALQTLYCGDNQLTALDVQGLTALQTLWCAGNRLTELNVQGLTALQWLNCWGNQLTADSFKKLFDDLPQRDAGDDARCILYIEEPGVTEGNYTDFITPSEVQAAFQNAKDVKKWKMYKRKMNGPGEEI